MMTELEEHTEAVRIEVAERVGWRSIEYSTGGFLVGYPPAHRSFRAVPSYARDMRATWELIEQLSIRGVGVSLRTVATWGPKRGYRAELLYSGKVLACAEDFTAPLALCQAYLKAPAGALTLERPLAKTA